MLEARNLTKRFGKLVATDDVTVEFGREDGEMVFIVGPNGAGKTTLVNLLTGLLSPDSGSVVLDGTDIGGLRPDERVHEGLVRSFQVVHVFEEMTVRENLRTAVLSERGKTRSAFSFSDEHEEVESAVDDLLDRFRLRDREHEVAETLPHGDRKLLDVAMSFGLDPKYLLLDEPTAGVSAEETEHVIETIVEVGEAEGVTTVAIEHDMDIVSAYADRVIALHRGGVLGEGGPSILETDDRLRRVLLGVEE
ncbi:ABC transporter ATP-binding protein [Halobaculum magnesiiphilum]|uniref:ABC transporter ATP-binding protein n=1 Tax=Halobaculum magnesiiphilum TaxID=1017351 RepID=A0A8T8WF20_9EURY|nr:ABC transporter ATP-binding protein [Halobaculum magnesiiphilum]QZP38334.1 ABC transporter ATP-binding protein [Halobaculum magnesiiphilum]